MSRDALIDRFEAGGRLLSYATSGLTPEQLTARPGPGAWSIAELAVHMLDSDLVASDRMKRLIAEENPTLQAYDENAWVARLWPNEMPVDEAVALFAANRKWVARLLRRCNDDDFARSGTHTEDGRKTLADMLTGYVGHLDHHLRFLYAKRAGLGAAVAPHYSDE